LCDAVSCHFSHLCLLFYSRPVLSPITMKTNDNYSNFRQQSNSDQLQWPLRAQLVGGRISTTNPASDQRREGTSSRTNLHNPLLFTIQCNSSKQIFGRYRTEKTVKQARVNAEVQQRYHHYSTGNAIVTD
jgi:hypothetical protein